MDKYIGESARLIREMFNYARDHQPCIIFMDEIDAIGGRRWELILEFPSFFELEEKRPIGRFLLALAEGLHVRALRALEDK